MKFTKDTNIFITGCGGMLGDAIYKSLYKITNVLATSKTENAGFITQCDVRDTEKLERLIKKFKPHIIFHLAALTDLEYCEKHPDEAWETNALATENIVRIAKNLDIPMVYICTAGIFDGKQDEYIDYDTPNPLNIYGKSKYVGELAVQRILPKHFIFRAGWMMGGGPKRDKKFVSKIMKQIEGGKKEIFVVDDKLGTPTYTFDFAKNMIEVIKKDNYGLYNQICSGSCSRYDVANEMLKITGSTKIKLQKVKSDYFAKEYFAFRPYSEKLIPFKLQKKGLYVMRDWRTCLTEYLNNWESYEYI